MIKTFFLFIILLYTIPAHANNNIIVLASTTSTQNSGLYDYLLPHFTHDTGIKVHVIAVGTGQAIRMAKNGDADVLLIHHRPSEEAFIADGFGKKRYDIMYNDFVIIGPKSTHKPTSLQNILHHIKSHDSLPFISRGDNSGTHKKEIELWESQTGSIPTGRGYYEIGAGMGKALNMAAAIGAYTLSDRGTWLSFNNKQNLTLVWSGDPILHNPYGLVLLNPTKFPHIKSDLAQVFAQWMISPKGQNLIGEFQINGKQLFCPNALKHRAITPAICPAN